MLKRKLAVLLAAATVCIGTTVWQTGMTAFAADGVESELVAGYQLFTERTGKFSVQIPQTWTERDSEEAAASTNEAVEGGVLDEYGYDSSQLEGNNADAGSYFYNTEAEEENINVQVTESGYSAAEAAEMLKTEETQSTFKDQYLAFGVDESDITMLGMVTYGENEYMGIKVKMFDVEMNQFVIAGEDYVYTLTFTGISDPAIMDNFLKTFTLN